VALCIVATCHSVLVLGARGCLSKEEKSRPPTTSVPAVDRPSSPTHLSAVDLLCLYLSVRHRPNAALIRSDSAGHRTQKRQDNVHGTALDWTVHVLDAQRVNNRLSRSVSSRRPSTVHRQYHQLSFACPHFA